MKSCLHCVGGWLTDWVLSHRKERDTLAYSFGEPKHTVLGSQSFGDMMKSPHLKLISPFGPLPQAGPTDLRQPWAPVLLLPFFLLAVFWGAYKVSSALSASQAWKTTACITWLLQAQWKCLSKCRDLRNLSKGPIPVI